MCPEHCLSHITVNQKPQKPAPLAPRLGLGVRDAFRREIPATRVGEACSKQSHSLALLGNQPPLKGGWFPSVTLQCGKAKQGAQKFS